MNSFEFTKGQNRKKKLNPSGSKMEHTKNKSQKSYKDSGSESNAYKQSYRKYGVFL